MRSVKFRNCPECGRPFETRKSELCPECTKQLDQEFEAVRQYLRVHRGASIEETTQGTGVDVGKILNWVQNGHLVLKS